MEERGVENEKGGRFRGIARNRDAWKSRKLPELVDGINMSQHKMKMYSGRLKCPSAYSLIEHVQRHKL